MPPVSVVRYTQLPTSLKWLFSLVLSEAVHWCRVKKEEPLTSLQANHFSTSDVDKWMPLTSLTRHSYTNPLRAGSSSNAVLSQ